MFAAALAPTIGFGLNWKRATATAAVVSIVLSLIINVVAFLLQLAGVTIPYGVSPGAIALLASSIAFVGISLVSRPPSIDADVDAVMDI